MIMILTINHVNNTNNDSTDHNNNTSRGVDKDNDNDNVKYECMGVNFISTTHGSTQHNTSMMCQLHR